MKKKNNNMDKWRGGGGGKKNVGGRSEGGRFWNKGGKWRKKAPLGGAEIRKRYHNNGVGVPGANTKKLKRQSPTAPASKTDKQKTDFWGEKERGWWASVERKKHKVT